MADGTDSDSRHHLSLTTPRDVQGSDNPIPLSPQWLLPNPGENKHGIVTGENHFSPYPGYPNHADTTKPSGNGDVWLGPSEHCNNSSNRTHPNGVSQVSQCSSLRVKKLSEKAVLPTRGSPLSAGYDLSSATETKVPARGKALVPTDLSIGIPEGTYAQIAPRSGLAWKHSIDVGAGVIDADYRGPVGVILFNHSDVDIEVKVGDRIAQLIIQKFMTPRVMEVKDLDSTERGVGGFKSTGV